MKVDQLSLWSITTIFLACLCAGIEGAVISMEENLDSNKIDTTLLNGNEQDTSWGLDLIDLAGQSFLGLNPGDASKFMYHLSSNLNNQEKMELSSEPENSSHEDAGESGTKLSETNQENTSSEIDPIKWASEILSLSFTGNSKPTESLSSKEPKKPVRMSSQTELIAPLPQSDYINQNDESLYFDPYLIKTRDVCTSKSILACFKYHAMRHVIGYLKNGSVNSDSDEPLERKDDGDLESSEQTSELTEFFLFIWRTVKKLIINSYKSKFSISKLLSGTDDNGRFLDEIADEIDTIENKKDSLFSRNRLKSLFIPMLIILKLFKLKLLFFLPFFLSIASIKKLAVLGLVFLPLLLAILLIFKPMTQSYTPPAYTPNGIGFISSHKEPLAYPTYNVFGVAGTGPTSSPYDASIINEDVVDFYNGNTNKHRSTFKSRSSGTNYYYEEERRPVYIH